MMYPGCRRRLSELPERVSVRPVPGSKRGGEPCGMKAYGSTVRPAVIADLEAVSVQRASARRHQLSVATTASAATGSGNSS
jgi:hypothetical protein